MDSVYSESTPFESTNSDNSTGPSIVSAVYEDIGATMIPICALIIFFFSSWFIMLGTQWRDMRIAELHAHQREELYQMEQLKARPALQALLDLVKDKDRIMPSIGSVYGAPVYHLFLMHRSGRIEPIVQSYRKILASVDEQLKGTNKVIRLPTSLRPNVLVRRDTQVITSIDGREQQLNLNQMKDFIGEQILLGQPPNTAEELQAYWHVIWERKVGVIIWIGDASCTVQDRKMWFDPYAPVYAYRMEEADWLVGPYKVTVKESFILRDEDDWPYRHRLKLSKKTGNRTEMRTLTIIHFDEWEKLVRLFGTYYDLDLKSKFVNKLVNGLAYAHYLQFKKRKKNEIPLPAMLVNCPSGIHQSVTFVLLYICRQMWLYMHKARVEAVIRYVRSHRYMAWDGLTDLELLAELKFVYESLKKIKTQLSEQEYKQKKQSSISVSL